MKVHYIQHVPFENLGSMAESFATMGHTISVTRVYEKTDFPRLADFDWLVIMGGPMGVHDEDDYPWLKPEKLFIQTAIDHGKIILGVCLGAQLIAHVLGADVYQNSHREIGWFDIHPCAQAADTIFSSILARDLRVFHWHADTFDIPDGAVPLAQSAACRNQGFVKDDRIAGFQFHLETTRESARRLIENCKDELDGSCYVQSEEQILSHPEYFTRINQIMHSVLNAMGAQE